MKKSGRMSIVMVEDDPIHIMATVESFKSIGINDELVILENGSDAIKYLKTSTILPDLILLDLNLPDMKGYEILGEIRAIEKYIETPVIILTASDDESEILKAYENKANAFIKKPLDIKIFLKVIKDLNNIYDNFSINNFSIIYNKSKSE